MIADNHDTIEIVDELDAADTIRMQIDWLVDDAELAETTIRQALGAPELEVHAESEP